MKKHLLFIFLLIISASAIFAGGAAETETPVQRETLMVEHSLGNAAVPLPPETTVTFAYDVLDILDRLEVPVAGVPKSNLPGYLDAYAADTVADAGTLFEPDFENLYTLHPDVVFISPRQASLYGEFEELAPTVYVSVDGSSYLDSVENNVNLLAGLYEKTGEAAVLMDALKGRAAAVSREVAGKTALVVLVNDGALSVFGPGSRFDVVYSDFGFTAADPEIEVSNHGQSATFEYLAEINPDYLLVLDRGAALTGKLTADGILDNPIVRATDAWSSGQVVYLDAQAWYLGSGGLTATESMIADIEGVSGL